MKYDFLQKVGIRLYFPLFLNFAAVGLFLFVILEQEKELKEKRVKQSLEILSKSLSQMQNALQKGAFEEVELHREYVKENSQATIHYLQNKNIPFLVIDKWEKQTIELSQKESNIQDLSYYQSDIFHKISQTKKSNEELMAYIDSDVKSQEELSRWALLVGILSFVTSVFLIYIFFTKKFIRPFEKLIEETADLANNFTRKIEPEQYPQYLKPLVLNISFFHEQLKRLRLISGELGAGNYHQDFSEFESMGACGIAMAKIGEKLQESQKEKQRRNWSGKGMEDFARILRQHNTDSDSICAKVISTLVPFIGANQGGIFLHEGEGEKAALVLKASYAWGRQKHLKKAYKDGEGIIGQVALEQEIILLTDIPNDFITIGSGLGDANPSCIIILPLMANGSFLGVLELASFHCFEDHEIHFLKGLCESMAAALFTLKTNERTKQLLEKANNANNHLRAQEEELRQSTEELISTQEDMKRKETELKNLFNSINYTFLMCELDPEGKILKNNRKFSDFFEITEGKCLNTSLFQLMEVPEWKENDYCFFWKDLAAGKPQNLESRVIHQENKWISVSVSPVLNAEGETRKFMLLGSDISEKKKAELEFIAQAESIMEQDKTLRSFTEELQKLKEELEEQIREISEEKAKNVAILEGCVDGVISFNEDGIVEFFNESAEEIWKVQGKDVLGRKIQSLIPVEIHEQGNERYVFYNKNGQHKELDMRTEVIVQEANGNEVEVLLTLTKVKVNGRYTFTAFAQNVAVELF